MNSPCLQVGTVSPPATPVVALSRLRAVGNQLLDVANRPVRLVGVNWFGMETTSFAPHGLAVRKCRDMLLQIRQLGFNTLRLPFSSEFLESQAPPHINTELNPEFTSLSGIRLLDQIVAQAGQLGLGIVLDHHRSEAGCGPNANGLWYTDAYPEDRWLRNWERLAAHYRGNPTIVGADLHNEPHGPATWGSGVLATDWRLAAERAGNAILAQNPEWLIFVEGIEVGASGHYWWGGNLSNAGQHPVRLAQPGRLVYSPHDYPASIYPQPWFANRHYPNNLNAIWERNWGYLFKAGTAPLFLGEFGSKLATRSDGQWLNQLVGYLNGVAGKHPQHPAAQISWAWWSWNPDSHDTGGILDDSWLQVKHDKLNALAPALGKRPR